MKFFPITLFLFLNTLTANEFPLIQPISVEKAPVIAETESTQKEVSDKNIVPVPTPQKLNEDLFAEDLYADDDAIAPEENATIASDKNTTETHTTILDVHFKPSSPKLTQESDAAIEEFANSLQENKSIQAVLYSYTDSSGDKEKNILLSKQRAKSVVNALISLGISSTRLTAIGMGPQNPIADNSTKEGREKNRRIEVLIIE